MTDDIKALFVEYCADDMLGGTLQMEPMAELAYRRICDMIYSTDDNLIDDDDVLKYSTKTGSKWKAIKFALIEQYDKIYLENGYIRQKKCTEKLDKSWSKIAQSSHAGKMSAQKRKYLKSIERGSTDVEIPLTENTLFSSTDGQPTKDPKTQGLTPLPPDAVDNPDDMAENAVEKPPDGAAVCPFHAGFCRAAR